MALLGKQSQLNWIYYGYRAVTAKLDLAQHHRVSSSIAT
jgi:hypothetical protein